MPLILALVMITGGFFLALVGICTALGYTALAISESYVIKGIFLDLKFWFGGLIFILCAILGGALFYNGINRLFSLL